MLEQSFSDIYTKFKLNFYRKIFTRFNKRESSLTAVETFCVEVIHALYMPTINEFARFVKISQPNATYKVQSLMKKGYIQKVQSPEDRREYRLHVTEKYFEYYGVTTNYVNEVLSRIQHRFSPEELETIARITGIINEELMPEIQLNRNDPQINAPLME
jgi:Transcriptional regulators